MIVEDVRYTPRPWSLEVERVGEFGLDALPADTAPATLRWIDALRDGSSAVHRLFVAIRPPEPIRDLLIDAMDDSADFRWQDEEQLHLTLRFVGEVERPIATDLADALGRVRGDRSSCASPAPGASSSAISGALWAGVEPKPPLAALAAKIERVCQSVGLEPERRAFHPHITLARWKGRRTREVQAFLERARGLASETVAGRRIHPLRKPPLPPRRALRRGRAVRAEARSLTWLSIADVTRWLAWCVERAPSGGSGARASLHHGSELSD